MNNYVKKPKIIITGSIFGIAKGFIEFITTEGIVDREDPKLEERLQLVRRKVTWKLHLHCKSFTFLRGKTELTDEERAKVRDKAKPCVKYPDIKLRMSVPHLVYNYLTTKFPWDSMKTSEKEWCIMEKIFEDSLTSSGFGAPNQERPKSYTPFDTRQYKVWLDKREFLMN